MNKYWNISMKKKSKRFSLKVDIMVYIGTQRNNFKWNGSSFINIWTWSFHLWGSYNIAIFSGWRPPVPNLSKISFKAFSALFLTTLMIVFKILNSITNVQWQKTEFLNIVWHYKNKFYKILCWISTALTFFPHFLIKMLTLFHIYS